VAEATHRPGEPMYEAFADAFDVHAASGAYNALYDRPAVLGLVGEVDGLDVLDAGCGPGFYAEELVARGARVTALDASPRMVELARARARGAVEMRTADLEQPLPWLGDASFDVVLLALVLHHVQDRVGMLRELRRVLRPTGRLVLSTVHPTSDWLWSGGGYFDVEDVEAEWNDGWQVRFRRQPLSAWCDELADAGFLVERVVEPLPAPEMARSHPDVHERLLREPGFLALSLVPR
jgi:SAM-dependent methyltransferase